MSDAPRRTQEPIAIHHDVEQPRSRVSWGAVLAGTLVALMVMTLIHLLVLGLGLQAIDPATERDPFEGVGTGALIGVIVANVIALFAGGWTAAKLANQPGRTDATLHGVLTWGLLTVLSFWLLSSAVGTLVSGVTGIVGQGLSAVGQGIGAVAPEAAQAVEDALADQGVSLDEIRQEIDEMATTDAEAPLADTRALVERFFTEEGEVDRQEVTQALAANTEMSEAEAEQQLAEWEARVEEAQQTVEEARQQAEVAAERASDAIGAAALWTFVGLLIGAIVAVLGSLAGRPATLTDATVTRSR